jgi:hypothetical protein
LSIVSAELHPNTVEFFTLTLVPFELSLNILKLRLFLRNRLVIPLLFLHRVSTLLLLLSSMLVLPLLLFRLVATLFLLNAKGWLVLLIHRLLLLLLMLDAETRVLGHILSLVHHFLLGNVLLGIVERGLVLGGEIAEVVALGRCVVRLRVVLLVSGQWILLISNIITKRMLLPIEIVLLLLLLLLLTKLLILLLLGNLVGSLFLLVVNASSLLLLDLVLLLGLLSAVNTLELINNISAHLDRWIFFIKFL